LISHPQGVDKRVGNHTRVTLLTPTPHGVADGLAVFGGCVQATQKRCETHCQVPIAAAARHETEVIEEDDEEADSEERKHQPQDPLGAGHLVFGDRWGIAAAGAHTFVTGSVHIGGIGVSALWGDATALLLLYSHALIVEPRRQLVSRNGAKHGRLETWPGYS
jgi:hypothetical protein